MNKIPGLKFLLVLIVGWASLATFAAWINWRVGGVWSVVSWGWEGDLFYNVYRQIASGQVPYVDFFIEYPPLVAYLIAWPAWLLPFVQLDAWAFRGLFVFGVGLLLAVTLTLVYKILYGLKVDSRKILIVLWLTVFNLIMAYTLVFTRFDVFPAVLTALGASLYLLYQRSLRTWHLMAAALLVVLAGFLKIYPFVLAPLVLLVELRRKRYINLLVVFGVLVLVTLVHLPFVVWGYENFEGFLGYQQNRSIQIESLYAGPIFLLEFFGLVEAPIALQNGTNTIATGYAVELAGLAQPIIIILLLAQLAWFDRLIQNSKFKIQNDELEATSNSPLLRGMPPSDDRGFVSQTNSENVEFVDASIPPNPLERGRKTLNQTKSSKLSDNSSLLTINSSLSTSSLEGGGPQGRRMSEVWTDSENVALASDQHPPTPFKGGLETLNFTKNFELPGNSSSFEGGGPQGRRMSDAQSDIENVQSQQQNPSLPTINFSPTELISIFSILFILTFVLFNFIFSPQYLVWLILLIPLAANIRWSNNPLLAKVLVGLALLVSVTTFLIYPLFYGELMTREWWMVIVLNLRNLSLLAIWLGLLWLVFDRARQVTQLS